MDFEWEQRADDIKFKHHMIAGCMAGIAEHTMMLPLDNVKTHLQIINNPKIGYFDIVKQIYSQGEKKNIFLKLGQFWKGCAIISAGCGPAHAAFFSIYEFAKVYLDINNEEQNPLGYALCGMIATIAHDSIITPFDVLKQRMQLLPNRSSVWIAQNMIINEGILSSYRSLGVTLMMNIPWSGVLVGTNESLKRYISKDSEHTFFSYFCIAAVSSAFASLMTIPLDNIKTRLQTQNCYYNENCFLQANTNKEIQDSKKVCPQSCPKKQSFQIKYSNINQTIQMIVKEEGFKGFVKGVGPKIISSTPSSAISWSIYEMIKRQLLKFSENHH